MNETTVKQKPKLKACFPYFGGKSKIADACEQ